MIKSLMLQTLNGRIGLHLSFDKRWGATESLCRRMTLLELGVVKIDLCGESWVCEKLRARILFWVTKIRMVK